jgi:hypothetical protein
VIDLKAIRLAVDPKAPQTGNIHCPVHDDTHPSLSMSVGPGDRLLVCCHAGCEQGAVFDEVRRRAGPLLNGHRFATGTDANITYVYRDAKGEPIARVIRTERADGGKDFRQQTPDGQGGWQWKGPKGSTPLYRLDELAKAPGAIVIVCEGEKAADAAQRRLGVGYVATSWMGGVAGVNRADLSPLAGRDVIVWPDADAPGAKAATALVARLRPTAKRVRVVRVDDLPAKADAADVSWTAAELEARVIEPEAAPRSEAAMVAAEVTVADFVAYLPAHNYIFTPTREPWPASSVDSRLPWLKDDGGKNVKPSTWLDQNRPVEQMAWVPGRPMLIKDNLISAGGWIHRPGCTTFNLYRPPTIAAGDRNDVAPWVNHIDMIYGDSAEHIITWLAHRVQKPAEKINHALVLGGAQGIGKDTILEPIKYAVGPWNFTEVSPMQVLGRFNGFVKSVILRVSEARDLGDVDRFAFYDHMKVYTAAPPDVLRCDEKNLREHDVLNVCGVVITSNHKSDGIYLPPDDRRHYVAWSSLTKDDFAPDYWRTLYGWYANGGTANVAAYLMALDISRFDPKAPPPKTDAFYEIVNANRSPEAAELADVIDACGWPPAVTLDTIIGIAATVQRHDLADFLKDRKNRRAIPHRLEDAGYVPVRNPDDKRDGQWRIDGKRQTAYARQNLLTRDRIAAVQALQDRSCR